MKMRILMLPLLLASLTWPSSAAAQWLHQWEVSSNNLGIQDEPIPQERLDWVTGEFIEAGRWMEDLGFPAPQMEPVSNGTKYYAQIDYDYDEQGGSAAALAHYDSDLEYIVIRPNLFERKDGSPRVPADLRDGYVTYQEGFMLAGVHELFHGVQQSYGPIKPTQEALAWIWEGMAEAVRYAWAEHKYGSAHVNSRDYDFPLNKPDDSAEPKGIASYNTGHFWYHLGGDIGSAGRVAYLQDVLTELGHDTDVDHHGLGPVARALERHDGGLYNLYPQLIARHANDVAFFDHEKSIHLAPGDRVVDDEAVYDPLKPLATNAYVVQLDVPEGETVGLEIRLRGEHESLQDLHLIIDKQRYDQPAAEEERNAYRTALSADTAPDTLFIRVANVAEDEVASQPRGYTLELSMEPVDPCSPEMMGAAANKGGFILPVSDGGWASMGREMGPQTGAGALRFDGLVSDTGVACTRPVSALRPMRTATAPETEEEKAQREEDLRQMQQELEEAARKAKEFFTRIAREVFGKDSMEEVTAEDYANMTPEQRARQMEMMGLTPEVMQEMRRKQSSRWLRREGDVVITVSSPNTTPWIMGMLSYPMATRHAGVGGWRHNAAGLVKLQLVGTSAAELEEGQTYPAEAYSPGSAHHTPGKVPTRHSFYTRWDGAWVEDCGEIPEGMKQAIEAQARRLDPTGELIDADDAAEPGCMVDATSRMLFGNLSGTVTIDEITGAEVQGTFSVSGPATLQLNGKGGERQRSGPLTIAGRFSAPTERRPVESAP